MASWTYIDGQWQSGNPPILGPMSHAMWLASLVFDGARAFEGTTPDLDRHCTRAVASAKALGLGPMLTPGEIEDIAREGVGHFAKDAALYIRPMFWAEHGFIGGDPDSTRFAIAVYDEPMPSAAGFSTGLSRFRRPSPETAPTDAKAACHYPNSGRAIAEVKQRGFDNAVMLDPLGHVAEFASSNLFLAKDGVVMTPEPNGTFLNGITRQRVVRLLRQAQVEVQERVLTIEDLQEADEIFSTGNFGKVQPVVRYEARAFEPGPLFRRARELYWAFAHNAL
ncbi:MAG TPA: branched-chain amino acid aminotransferase [Aliidongia sp.]|uniref:branched-chain amino acid aminotransferase n=1 Tax=Aliidongia sp. TaxID=1914230 RepID=UPI002DDDAA3B|nr:branched-chain amino acid aminotransferase [Aliidongia sp.]HEV2672922.1 branched-chain amino acid aminotransferase [Aliidongia sp.]